MSYLEVFVPTVLGFFYLFNIKSRFSNFLLNNRKKVGKVGTESEGFTARCFDCRFWVGRCLKGRVSVIASSPACELFEPKDSVSVFLSVPKRSDNYA